MKEYYATIHLSARYRRIGIFSDHNLLKDSFEVFDLKTNESRSHAASESIISDSIDSLLSIGLAIDENFSLAQLKSYGVIVPGPVEKGTSIVKDIPAIPSLQYKSISDLINTELKKRGAPPAANVHVENDANAQAIYLSKSDQRFLADETDVLFVYISYGLGGAFISDGKLRRGATGQAGEIGHMIVQPSGRLCECSGRGCWETLVSGIGLEKSVERLALGIGEAESHNYLRIIELAVAKDEDMVLLFHDFGKYLGIGLASLANIWNPSEIVISGDFGSCQSLFVNPMKAEFERRVYTDMQCPITFAKEDTSLLSARYLIDSNASE